MQNILHLENKSYIKPTSMESKASATFEQMFEFMLSNNLLVSVVRFLVTPNMEFSVLVGRAVGSGRSTRTVTTEHIHTGKYTCTSVHITYLIINYL